MKALVTYKHLLEALQTLSQYELESNITLNFPVNPASDKNEELSVFVVFTYRGNQVFLNPICYYKTDEKVI